MPRPDHFCRLTRTTLAAAAALMLAWGGTALADSAPAPDTSPLPAELPDIEQETTAQSAARAAFEGVAASTSPARLHASCESKTHALSAKIMQAQTQMMMVSLACGSTLGDNGLRERYRDYSNTNLPLIKRAQNDLIDRFGGGESGHEVFDDYWTELANKEAEYLREISRYHYCRVRMPVFEQFDQGEPQAVAREFREGTLRWISSARCGTEMR